MTDHRLLLVLFVIVIIAIYYGANKIDPCTVLRVQPSKHNTTESSTSCVIGRPCTYPDTVDIRIIVITFNRASSLSKLLHSLDTLVVDGDSAALEIWIDRSRNGAIDDRTVKVASSFRWKVGPTRVHVQTHNAGIMGQWIDTWRPQDDSDIELGLILEDDIDVSPYAYRWLRAVHRAYRHRKEFAGATIQMDKLEILSADPKGPMAGPKNDTLFMYKALGTWGCSPRPFHWRRFQDWFHQHKPSVRPGFRLFVPAALPWLWYRGFAIHHKEHNMWEMWLIYFMHIEQLYGVYSNLNVYTGGRENCLCVNRREPGLHYKGKAYEPDCRLMTVWKEEYVKFPNNIVRLHWDGTRQGY